MTCGLFQKGGSTKSELKNKLEVDKPWVQKLSFSFRLEVWSYSLSAEWADSELPWLHRGSETLLTWFTLAMPSQWIILVSFVELELLLQSCGFLQKKYTLKQLKNKSIIQKGNSNATGSIVLLSWAKKKIIQGALMAIWVQSVSDWEILKENSFIHRSGSRMISKLF